jgi:hypothetical protein
VEKAEASRILLQPRRTSRRRLAESARVSTELRDVAERHRDIPQEPRNVAEEHGDGAEKHRDIPEKYRDIPEEHRDVAEELGNDAEEHRNGAEELGNSGEIQINGGELRKKPGELSVRGSTSHRNVLDRLRKVGGTYEIAPGHVGNGAGHAEKLGPAARREAELLRDPAEKAFTVGRRATSPGEQCL